MASRVEFAPVPAMTGIRLAARCTTRAHDADVLLDAQRRRFAGRADRDDAVGAVGDVEFDQAIERLVIDRAVRLHGRDERHDAAAEHGDPWDRTGRRGDRTGGSGADASAARRDSARSPCRSVDVFTPEPSL